ncbi:hypothetical protein OSTOST_25999, partial [Ostertagia ostertagi]
IIGETRALGASLTYSLSPITALDTSVKVKRIVACLHSRHNPFSTQRPWTVAFSLVGHVHSPLTLVHNISPMVIYLTILAALSGIAQAQFLFGLLPQIPLFTQQPFALGQNLPPWETQMTPTQPLMESIEDVPNPDLEPGQWAVPDPQSWPLGPDWNDPRNTWAAVNGWTSDETTTTTETRSR